MRVKFFLGCALHGELKVLLSKSSAWQEAQLFKKHKTKIVTFGDREYIGEYADMPCSFRKMKTSEVRLKLQLQEFCPKLNPDKYAFVIFPQIFSS